MPNLVRRWLGIASFLCLITASGLATQSQSNADLKSQPGQYWTDPATKLTWTAKDNGKDISYYKAIKYCRDLRVAGFSGWRLASMFELQPLYDKSVESPGRAGDRRGGNPRNFTWHVKGGLFLTGDEWSDARRLDDRGKPSGYGWYFDFNSGQSTDDNLGYSAGKRALCVRGNGDPFAGQRQPN
jgi:hypothetical protein